MKTLRNKQQKLIFRMALIGFFVIFAILIYFLFFMHAKVSVQVMPENAIVTLDNRPTAVSGGSASFVTSLGRHTLRVEADKYVGFKEEINLARGQNYSKKISLTKAPEPVEIVASAQNIAVKDNEIYYFNPADRLFYLSKVSYAADGTASVASTQPITSKPTGSFDKIVWAPSRELVLIKRGTSVYTLDFKKYDFVNQNEVLFGNDIGDIAWAPDSSRVAYSYSPPDGEKSLIFSDPFNQNIFRAANLAAIRIDNPFIAFSPSSEWLAVIPRNQNFDQNQIYLMNVYTKAIKLASPDGNQKEAAFTSDSKKIVYSTYDSNLNNPVRQLLSVMDLDGTNKKAFGIAARASNTRYFKDSNQIFLPSVSGQSKMVLVDVSSGRTSEFYFSGQGNSNISEIFLNYQNTGAIFISAGKLYFVKLEGNG